MLHNLRAELIDTEWQVHIPALSDHKGIVVTIKEMDIQREII